MAMAMDESFASNIALQINGDSLINLNGDNSDLIIKQLIEKDIMLQEDEKYARSLMQNLDYMSHIENNESVRFLK